MAEYKIEIKGSNRIEWISRISSSCNEVLKLDNSIKISINILGFERIDEFLSFHMVTFACFVQYLLSRGFNVGLNSDNIELRSFLEKDIRFAEYWTKNNTYIETKRENILNLWRVNDSDIDQYSDNVVKYLKRDLFREKDLSAVKNSLLEIFYNISDHSDSEGNAFSYLHFDKTSSRLYVAVCDFGKGIAESIRGCYPDIGTDVEAVVKSTKDKVTSASRDHNMGMGLPNIISHLGDGDTFRILSNSALFLIVDKYQKAIGLPFNFSGTIIYYDISLKNFENEEINTSFVVDFEI